MPTYDFKCKKCSAERKNVLLRITHDDADRPHCCGEVMQQHFTVPPASVVPQERDRGVLPLNAKCRILKTHRGCCHGDL